MVLLLNGNTPKNLGVTAASPSFKFGIKVGKTALGALASLVFTFVKSTASPACSKWPVKLPATPKVAILLKSIFIKDPLFS